ncbi:molybdenum cofactor guanylyltransferase [Sphingomonas baiyangensis]|uniref:Molybdenum cofactor guanylyltransferase n=1 Tax=Sphingomonas baiyangensis TaxID=2572576 RepID=A0A4U1L2E6_9SPHN|nr:molybdenum cofactor guanylyltransferase [Sphingomonas baiyangensis]TKD51051.1 molybdenum cofactor guanylyltransferase [Sphingomonas baiyangensis]
MTLLGVVLAGGEARRFGSDKALALLGDRPLIAHAAAILAPWVADLLVVGRSEAPVGRTVHDWPREGLGPLGGICGALKVAAAEGHTGVLTIACDMPRVPEALVASLTAMPGAAYVRQSPVMGRWPVAAFASLERWLEHGDDRSVVGWAHSIGAATVEADGDLPNVNRPGDLSAL